MHRSFDKSGETVNGVYRSWGIGFFALYGLLTIALIGLVITQPAASNWISEAAQAESAGSSLRPEIAPTQIVQPTGEIHIVRAN